MSGVTNNGGHPGNQLWKRSDGRFSALAERRSNHPSFRVRAWFKGESQATENHPTSELAIQAAKALWADYEAGRLAWEPAPETLGELVERYEKRTDVTARHLGAWRRQVASAVAAIGADAALSRLSSHSIRDALEPYGWAAGTWNLTLIRVGQLFGWAVDRGWMDIDPSSRLKRREDPRNILPWLPYADWPAFLAAEPSEGWRLRLAFALETGLRPGELVHSQRTWLELRTTRPIISVQSEDDWEPKTRRSTRAVPLSARAVEIVVRAKELWPDDGPLFGVFRLNAIRKRVMRACGLAGVQPINGHGLRRSAGARWIEAGVPLIVVSRWMGHASTSITEQCYAGLSDQVQASAVDQVDAHAAAWESGAVVALRPRRA